jgi:hypothetical protein
MSGEWKVPGRINAGAPVPFDARVRTVVDGQRKTFESLGCIVEQADPEF